MKNAISVKYTLLCGTACCMASAVQAQRNVSDVSRMNVLFLMADDMRPELGCYGVEAVKTPNMDRLASSGVLFQNAYCNVPVSGASRASLLTGVYPHYPDRFVNFSAYASKDCPEAIPLSGWFTKNVAEDWMSGRQEMMSLLQDEAQLNEIVQMVGMDALSAPDRLKMEAARSIREDFLHQNSFHEVDTYTSLKKQLLMMRLVLAYYDKSVEALGNGAGVQDLIKLPVREQIGRYKYTLEENLDAEYQKVLDTLDTQIADVCGKEDF